MKHFLRAFLIAVVGYAALYWLLQHNQSRQGPWEITFTNQSPGLAALVVNQPKLRITNAAVVFSGHTAGSNDFKTLRLDRARPVPFAVPFGHCIFLDNTSLPGSATFQLFSNQVELLPRGLIINARQYPWPATGGELKVGQGS